MSPMEQNVGFKQHDDDAVYSRARTNELVIFSVLLHHCFSDVTEWKNLHKVDSACLSIEHSIGEQKALGRV